MISQGPSSMISTTAVMNNKYMEKCVFENPCTLYNTHQDVLKCVQNHLSPSHVNVVKERKH